MPMNWTPEADAKLFAAFIKVHDLKSINYKAMADIMDCTPKAITHRLAIIRNKHAKGDTSNSTSTATKIGSSTPASKKRADSGLPTPETTGKKANRKSASNKRKRSHKDDHEDTQLSEDEDEDEESNNRKLKSFDDIESGEDAEELKDRSSVRRSVSARPGCFAGMDDEEEEEHQDAGQNSTFEKVFGVHNLMKMEDEDEV